MASREAEAARAAGRAVNASTIVAQLFDEFVEAHASRQRIDVRDYLLRAGPAAGELGLLIDRFLEVAPIEEPDAETIVVVNARLEHVTPLTAARTRLRLRVDDVVDRLREALGLEEATRARLRRAYQELEGEQLDPAGVHDRVWEALRSILGLDPRRLLATEKPTFAALVYSRAADFKAVEEAGASARQEESDLDEVDLLFRSRGLE